MKPLIFALELDVTYILAQFAYLRMQTAELDRQTLLPPLLIQKPSNNWAPDKEHDEWPINIVETFDKRNIESQKPNNGKPIQYKTEHTKSKFY